MHESGIAARVISVVEAARDEAGAGRVLRVDLRVGDLVFVDVEQLRQAYMVLSSGTGLCGSQLRIERVPGRVHCVDCEWEREIRTDAGLPAGPLFACHRCGGDVRIVDGRQCEVVGMSVE